MNWRTMQTRVALTGLALALTGIDAFAGVRAREALEILERDQGSQTVTNVVGMVGFNGYDQPDTWRLLVRDETNPAVLREFVVSGGKVTARNDIQKVEFADLPEKPLLSAVWRVDSSEAYRIADDTAILAGITFVRLNYQLRFRGNDPAPTWLVTCIDAAGTELGQIVIDAADGTIPYQNFPGAAPVAGSPGAEPAAVAPTPATPATGSQRNSDYSSRGRLRNLFAGPRRRQGNSR